MSASTESLGTPVPRRRASAFLFPALVVCLVLGGLALVVRSSTAGGGVYDMTLSELSAQSSGYIGKDVRVNGRVQSGTFRDLSSANGVHIVFSIGDASGQTMEVHYRQLLPDAFEEGREVIVQGKLESMSSIECNRLTVKCPSKYQDENASQAGQYYEKKKEPVSAPDESKPSAGGLAE